MKAAGAAWVGLWRLRAQGVALALVVSAVSTIAAHGASTWLFGTGRLVLSPVLCAVVAGVLWRHYFGLGEESRRGVEWIANSLLRLGIALVGLQLTWSGASAVAGTAVPVVAACVLTAFGASMLFGRLLGLASPLQRLLAVGSAICGCTAVVATAPVVRARAEEIGVALACVVLIGGAGMLMYPWLAHQLFAETPELAAVFLGTSIHDTSQVVAASLIYEQHFAAPGATAMAGATKLLRNVTLLIVVPLLALRAGAGRAERPGLAAVLPGFIVAFLALALVRYSGDTLIAAGSALEASWLQALELSKLVSGALLATGMCAVGLSVSAGDIRRMGWRAPVAAVAVAACVAGVSLGALSLVAG